MASFHSLKRISSLFAKNGGGIKWRSHTGHSLISRNNIFSFVAIERSSLRFFTNVSRNAASRSLLLTNGASKFTNRGFAITFTSLLELPSKRAKNITELTADDIIPQRDYARFRREYLQLRKQIKNARRCNVGPDCSITFENYDLMWFQVQEMVEVEKGGAEQIQNELIAYNPLIPKGNNLPFTLMFGFQDVEVRRERLSKLGWVEDQVFLSFAGQKVRAVPSNEDLPRTTSDGKTSSVHFLSFNLSPQQIKLFKGLAESDAVTFSIEHKEYNHATTLAPSLVQLLQGDLK